MKLNPQEAELVGRWIIEGGETRADPTCERIEWLTDNHLRRIAVSNKSGAWETLFQDPDDGPYWERTYPKSEMHGGGPPVLRRLSEEQAKRKYDYETRQSQE
jgi:hypothetical protein